MAKVFSVDDLDRAFNAEIERVGGLDYPADRMCQHFYGQLRSRLTAEPDAEQKTVTVHRSKFSGRIVSKHYAKTHPCAVVSQQVPAPTPPKPKASREHVLIPGVLSTVVRDTDHERDGHGRMGRES